MSFKGYFAITSATIQAGAALRVWADIGIAGIEGGFGFDAICYLVPKFYFELDLHAYLAVDVFGMDFASVHLDGLLAGPGRWRIAGRAKVNTPWPLPDFSLNVDEIVGHRSRYAADHRRRRRAAAKEIAKIANWSAQLPKGGETYLTLAEIEGAEPTCSRIRSAAWCSSKSCVPFELRLAKASGSKIDGRERVLRRARSASTGQRRRAAEQTGSTLQDFFAAAQFLEMSQDDRMTKPSFEIVRRRDTSLTTTPTSWERSSRSTLNYEEADLAAPRNFEEAATHRRSTPTPKSGTGR